MCNIIAYVMKHTAAIWPVKDENNRGVNIDSTGSAAALVKTMLHAAFWLWMANQSVFLPFGKIWKKLMIKWCMFFFKYYSSVMKL